MEEVCLHEWVEQKVGCCKKWVCTKCGKMWMHKVSPYSIDETNPSQVSEDTMEPMKIKHVTISIDPKTAETLRNLKSQWMAVDQQIRLVCQTLINSSDKDKNGHYNLSEDCRELLLVRPGIKEEAPINSTKLDENGVPLDIQ